VNIWLAIGVAVVVMLAVVTAAVIWLDRSMDKVLEGRDRHYDDDPAR
jgi:hypothetical protein